jgi:Fe-S-cluster containining protein
MIDDPDSSLASSNIRVEFSVNGRRVRVDSRLPAQPARLDQLLPVLRTIDDHLIDATVARHKAAGKHISCAKGCSACCRTQPVPVTPPEAFALARLVDAMPEPRRTATNSAFSAAVELLRAADLYNTYMQRDPEMTRETAMATTRQYTALSLTCPFLVDDVCSIYADRPFVCRQYLVTSPSHLCTAPLDNPVQPVNMPAHFATAMLRAAETLSGRVQYTVPLVLALDCANANRLNLERTYEPKTAFGTVMNGLKEA